MLGVTTRERIEAIPDVPPLTEVGLKQFDAVSWFMLVAPIGTPKEIVGKLHREVTAVIADPEVRREFVKLGLVPVQSPPPEALPDFMRSEIERWGEIVKRAGLAGSQ
jgi:tripartite-type tricarboxylate transporter receptor subunit TctC